MVAWRRWLVAALMPAALLSGCGLQRGLDGSVAGQGATTAPTIVGTDLGGRHVDTTSMSSHPRVIDFWASWCGPCRAEQGDLNRLHDRYAPHGVGFLGVDLRDDAASARAFVDEFRVAYPSVPDDGALAGSYDVAAPPEIIIVDGGGRIVKRLLGTTVGLAETLDGLLR
ncbi:MAG: TlpA family protein disulfide reductase [Candidatus Dormibacteria bacterium]